MPLFWIPLKSLAIRFVAMGAEAWQCSFKCLPKSRNRVAIPIHSSHIWNMFLLCSGFCHLNKTLFRSLVIHFSAMGAEARHCWASVPAVMCIMECGQKNKISNLHLPPLCVCTPLRSLVNCFAATGAEARQWLVEVPTVTSSMECGR
jgi:hypothetical protein